MLSSSCSCWPETVSQSFTAATPGHCVLPCHVCSPLASADCVQTHSQTRLTLSRFRFSRHSLSMDPTENTTSHNPSTVPCISVATLMWCLLCCNLAQTSPLVNYSGFQQACLNIPLKEVFTGDQRCHVELASTVSGTVTISIMRG
jgi:hypothetical protein